MRASERKIKTEIANRRLTYEQVSAAAGMSPSWAAQAIRRIEAGVEVTPATIGALAEGIGCAVDDLLADEVAREAI